MWVQSLGQEDSLEKEMDRGACWAISCKQLDLTECTHIVMGQEEDFEIKLNVDTNGLMGMGPKNHRLLERSSEPRIEPEARIQNAHRFIGHIRISRCGTSLVVQWQYKG